MTPELIQFLVKVGNQLNFDVRTEVQASESACVDVVWFDKQLPIPGWLEAEFQYAVLALPADSRF